MASPLVWSFPSGLRVVGFSSPEFYTADWDLGYRLIPGMTGTYSSEGRSFVSINSDGFRDREHTLEKPADVVRIAIIGDSYVEGLQVERDEAFTSYWNRREKTHQAKEQLERMF